MHEYIINPADAARLGVWPDRLEHLDRKFSQWIEEGDRQAIVARIMRRGEEIFAGAYGYSTLEPEGADPARLDHIFPVASNTKSITATLIMQLMEDGELDVYDPVGKYIDFFNTRETKDIQLWHLATHSSGIVDEDHNYAINDYIIYYLGIGIPEWDAPDEEWKPVLLQIREKLGLPPVADDILRPDTYGCLARKIPYKPREAPGKMNSYCNCGYGYLKEILEKVSGKDIDTLARERLFEPLGMVDSHFFLPKEKYDRVIKRPEGTHGYPWQNMDACFQNDSGAGGLKTTARDILRFCEMIRRGGSLDGARILSPLTVRAMIQNHNLPPEFDAWSAWAFGFNYRGTKHDDLNFTRSPSTIDHGGWGGAKFIIDPENELSIALYTIQFLGGSEIFSHMTNVIYSALY